MDLSVVIRCCDDERVFKCIESIDEDVEIIVSLCENKLIQDNLEEMNIRYCVVKKGNLSLTSNAGFKVASHRKVIITDSDTIFSKKCIKMMYTALNKYKVVRARIIFQKKDQDIFSRIAAEARDYVNSLPVVYTPGIGVAKELIHEIGGYLFNDPVPFAADADLNFRINNAKIPFKYLNSACIIHVPIPVKHDLRAAFRIGSGCALSAFILHKKYPSHSEFQIRKSLKGVKFKHYFPLYRKYGALVLIYQIIWDFFFFTGQIIRLINLSN